MMIKFEIIRLYGEDEYELSLFLLELIIPSPYETCNQLVIVTN